MIHLAMSHTAISVTEKEAGHVKPVRCVLVIVLYIYHRTFPEFENGFLVGCPLRAPR